MDRKYKRDIRSDMRPPEFGKFERWLTVYVALCILIGLFIGYLNPGAVKATLESMPMVLEMPAPMVVYIWLMLMPLMLRVDVAYPRQGFISSAFRPVHSKLHKFGALLLATWVLKPLAVSYVAYVMLNLFGSFPLSHVPYYIAGLVLLGCAPASPLLFSLVELTRASASLARHAFSLNMLLMVVLYPLVAYLLLSRFATSPSLTELYSSSVMLVLIPFLLAVGLRRVLIEQKGRAWYKNVFFPKVDALGIAAYFALIIVVFSINSELVLSVPGVVSVLAVPIVLGIIVSFILSLGLSMFMRLGREDGMVAVLSGTVSSYELGAAMGIATIGISSPALLALSLYPLLEMPFLMLCVVLALKMAPPLGGLETLATYRGGRGGR
ncbi:MAG: Arsenical-resistance protein [Methanosarcinales archeaon 56_1174]|nr:arsenic resistance protein [Methermicoccus shengliensis]KUK04196.1 MAG: Arsenical-resistance protein [Euryarchaeota archaeon 55_53]KUK29771.1 MAG: Arsenical-resistance protein [Methanosarcinales archeaon 56_1174]